MFKGTVSLRRFLWVPATCVLVDKSRHFIFNYALLSGGLNDYQTDKLHKPQKIIRVYSQSVPIVKINKCFNIKLWKFSYPSFITFVLGVQRDPLIETVHLSTHKICFGWQIRKFFFLLCTLIYYQTDKLIQSFCLSSVFHKPQRVFPQSVPFNQIRI